MKVVIVGGVAGGATAAARLRRLDEGAEIVMIERTGYVSYANCGLPYYIGGAITERSKLTFQTPQSFRGASTSMPACVRKSSHRPRRRRLPSASWTTARITSSATTSSSCPPRPPRDARTSPASIASVFSRCALWRTPTPSPTRRPRRRGSATVVGGGFIGLEMAENLRERGIAVAVVQRGEHVMPVFDADMASLVHNLSASMAWNCASTPTSPALRKHRTRSLPPSQVSASSNDLVIWPSALPPNRTRARGGA